MSKPAPKKGPRSMSAPARTSAPRTPGRPGPRPSASAAGDTRPPRPAGRTRTAPEAGSDYRAPRPAGRTRTAGPEADTRSPRPAGRTRTAPEAGSDYRTPRPAGRTRTAGPEADTRSPRPDKRTRTAAPETPKVRAPRPPAQRRPPRAPGANDERLQKILAAAGIDSRRACEEIILEGRVQINGVTVTELGTKADPRRDEITVDLIPIQREAPVYILMNKPKGYVTTVKDDQGRPTVMALLKDVAGRVYPVGRLDYNSEGLLLMTNDGALAQILMGPEHEVPKVYLVKVHRTPKPELLREFQEGFLLSGRRLKPCHIEIAEKGDNPWLKVTLTEGKNQQIRRMFAAVGHPVSKLRRVQFGPLADPLLKPGTWRYLSPQEITAIKSL